MTTHHEVTTRRTWGVYCKDGHSCVGPFETELEALELAVKLNEEAEAVFGGKGGCVYNAIPLLLQDVAPATTDDPRRGYL